MFAEVVIRMLFFDNLNESQEFQLFGAFVADLLQFIR